MNTATYQVESKQAAIAAATQLLERSAWFEVEPRPFDWYSFTVKAGEGHEIVFQQSTPCNKGMMKVVVEITCPESNGPIDNMKAAARLLDSIITGDIEDADISISQN